MGLPPVLSFRGPFPNRPLCPLTISSLLAGRRAGMGSEHPRPTYRSLAALVPATALVSTLCHFSVTSLRVLSSIAEGGGHGLILWVACVHHLFDVGGDDAAGLARRERHAVYRRPFLLARRLAARTERCGEVLPPGRLVTRSAKELERPAISPPVRRTGCRGCRSRRRRRTRSAGRHLGSKGVHSRRRSPSSPELPSRRSFRLRVDGG
jgi:hypothetical protein